MTAADSGTSAGPFEIGVAVIRLGEMVPAPRSASSPGADSGIAGFDEAKGGLWHATQNVQNIPILIEKGDDAVRAATEAIAGQIGLAAKRIARSIEEQMRSAPPPAGALDLDSVSVTFGITLAAGLQAVFTAQATSSAQVTITLSRPGAGPGSVAP